MLLDTELLPWSLKAEPLLREQYAAVGAAARASLPVAVSALEAARSRGLDVDDLLTRTKERVANAEALTAAYRPYCWPEDGLDGVQAAPFQVLVSAGRTWHDHDHLWHLAVIDRLAATDPVTFRPTRRVVVDLAAHVSRDEATRWWEELTASGGEGMVVKPLGNLTRTPRAQAVTGPARVRPRSRVARAHGPGEPLWRLHEPVFAVLAMESEPVDPRL